MYILLVIPILIVLMALAILLLLFKKWKLAISTFILACAINIYTKQVPFPLSYFGQSPDHNVKLLTYNVHGSGDGFGAKAKDFEKLITEADPDVVYLTEYYEANADSLDKCLKRHFTNTYLEWGNGERLYTNWRIAGAKHIMVEMNDEYSDDIKKAINTSWIYRFVLVNDANSTRNDIFDSRHEEYVDESRKNTKVDSIILYTCHLETNNYGAIRDSISDKGWRLAKHLQKFIGATKKGYEIRKLETDCIYNSLLEEDCRKVIVMGDMNDINGSYTIKNLKAQDSRMLGGKVDSDMDVHSIHTIYYLDWTIFFIPNL